MLQMFGMSWLSRHTQINASDGAVANCPYVREGLVLKLGKLAQKLHSPLEDIGGSMSRRLSPVHPTI